MILPIFGEPPFSGGSKKGLGGSKKLAPKIFVFYTSLGAYKPKIRKRTQKSSEMTILRVLKPHLPCAVLLNTSPVCLPSSKNLHDPRMQLVAAPASL